MKRLLTLIWLCGAQMALAALPQVQVVVPGGLSNVEGNSATSEPFNSTTFRFQQVFDASQFAMLAAPTLRIDQIWFRIDGASTNTVALAFDGSTVQLSTTTRAPDSLGPVFAENVGVGAVTIYNEALTFGAFYQPGATPQPFHQTVIAIAPFYYTPVRGNLLLDITAGSGRLLLPGGMDAESILGDSVSRVYANSCSAVSGTADTFGLVTRFDIALIPEPSSWLLVGAGLVLMGLFRRR